MKKIYLSIFFITFLLLLFGCSKRNSENIKEKQGIEENFGIQKYKKRYTKVRKKLIDIKSDYEKEAAKMKHKTNQKLSFQKCKFNSFPDIDKVFILETTSSDIGINESIRVIREWIKEIDEEKLDLEKELRDDSGTIGEPVRKNGHAYWPLVYDNMQKLKNGNSFYINTASCHVQMGRNGFYSMSDGTITKYLDADSFAVSDAMGENQEDIIKEGTVEEMEKESYELLSGNLTISNAVEIVKEYFKKGTPYPLVEGLTVDVPYAEVYRLRDKYGYGFLLRRKYKGIPFAWQDYGERSLTSSNVGKELDEDTKRAYVADDHVCAFVGQNEGERIEEIEEQTSVLSLCDAAETLEEKLAPELQISLSEVEFEYCPSKISEEQCVVVPVWMFDGLNQTDNRRVRIYVDALTGDITYYTYSFGEEDEAE